MTLKDTLLKIATAPQKPAGDMDAPELGPGAKLHFKRLSLGERLQVLELARDKELNPVDRQIQILSVVLADADGTAAFPLSDSDDDAALKAMPDTLADRAMEHLNKMMNRTAEAIDEGKDSSAKIPNSES